MAPVPHVLLRRSYRLALGLEGPPQKVFRWAVQPIGDVFQIRKRDVYGPRFDVANIALAVPLSRQAVTILRELHPVTGSGRYLLPSVRTTARAMSDNTLNAALAGWDIRRTT